MATWQTIRTGDVEIGYEEHGAVDGPVVVLLHGFPDSPRTWDGVVDALGGAPEQAQAPFGAPERARAPYGAPWQAARIVVPYLRGYGPSRVLTTEAAAGQVAALAQDVLDLADALHLPRFVLVGNDWGGRAAQGVALLAPDRLRAVVLLATPYGSGDLSGEERLAQAQAFWYQWYFHTPQGRQTLERDRRAFCRHLWRAWSPGWRFAECDFTAAAAAFDNDQFVDTVLRYYRHRWGNAPSCPRYAAQQAVLDGLPPMRVPATLVMGSADAVIPPATARGTERHHAAGLRLVEVEGAGHFIQRQQPALVAELIRDACHGAP